MLLPDFVNASPKLRFTVRKVEKWFHCEVLLRQEECLSEVSPVLWHSYSDCRDCCGCLKMKHMQICASILRSVK